MADEIAQNSGIRAARLVPLFAILIAAGVFWALGGEHYLSFAALAQHRIWLKDLVARSPGAAALFYLAAYVLIVALSVPGAAIMTMTGGFLFGTFLGGVFAVVGATLGATLVFVAARAGLGGVLGRAGAAGRKLEAGFRADAFNYLLAMRLLPLFPFWLVNLAAAVAEMRLDRYMLATLLGMIPASFVFASVGNGLDILVKSGQSPDFAMLLRPDILLPILGLATLALIPPAFRLWRGKRTA